ncbi:MAG: protein BatD [Idiomarina sp.]|nr:protein BatD [Idiomarina sp.]
MIKYLLNPRGWLTLMMLIAWLPGAAMALNVSAEIDKNPVIVDESFTLTITADDDLPRNAFRSDVLLNHFIVGATSVDRSSQIINGQMSRQTRWRLTLIARRPGQYEIPSFDIDGQRTSPIVVDVIEPGESEGDRGPVFITASIDSDTPYIQQQVRYTVRLHLAHNLESGSISPPQVSNADIQQASSDEDTQELVDGQRYRVITRTYFITPRRSGEILIEGSRFDGQIRDTSQRSFTSFSRPQTVSALAPDITLDVRPQPAQFTGDWLPSEHVALSEDWDETQTFTVGEPINRRISMIAQGVRDEQLPELSHNYPTTMRYYAERTERESFSRQGQRFARAQYRGVIIPAQAGTFELPEIKVNWWDINAEQMRTARIPARTIEVTEPPGGQPSPFAQPQTLDNDSAPLSPPQLSVPAETSAPDHHWRTAATTFAVLWILTLLAFVYMLMFKRPHQEKQKDLSHTSGLVPAASRQPLQKLKQACQGQDAHAAHQALNQWIASRQGAPTSAENFARQMNSPELLAAVETLHAAIYAAEKPQWQGGSQLWQAVQALHKPLPAKAGDQTIPELYPSE